MSELDIGRSAIDEDEPSPRHRIRRVFSGSGALIRIAYRDPEHIAERMTLYAIDRLGEASLAWAASARAANPDAPPGRLAGQLRIQSARIARIDGAIAGTPFFLALIPGYLTYLWQEMRMTLRTAALYGRDPRRLHTAAEILALRGVHANAEAAETALLAVQGTPMPDRPAERRSLRMWVRSVRQLLVFGGFISRSRPSRSIRTAGKLRAALMLAIAGAVWVMTWVLPVTFMIAMAWGCETHTRQLGRRALTFYEGGHPSIAAAISRADMRRDRGHDLRTVLRAAALCASIAIPIAFVAYVVHVRNTAGINWVVAVGALVALSLVIATAVISARR